MTNPNMTLHQLYILRSQVDLLIAMEEGAAVTVETGCAHPEDQRTPSNNMGEAPQYFCGACKQFVAGSV